MQTQKSNDHSLLPWKHYLTVTAELLLAFYLATFSLAMYFTHRGTHWVFQAVILVILYLFVIYACGKRLLQSLPLAAIMLIIPMAPLIALTLVISLIPVLQYF